MIRFNLVMADTDELYITCLSKFANNAYTSKFNLNVFTQKLHLVNYINSCRDKIDILLVAPELLPDNVTQLNVGIVIVLSDGRQPQNFNGTNLPHVNKYQPGEKVLSSVIELYSGENTNIQSVVKGTKRTSVVTVFSPYGGCGKTVISVWLAMQFAKMHFRPLYLNLESLNSIPFFAPHIPTSQGLSSVLLHLKTAPDSLAIKLDTALSVNSHMNISYLQPPCCCLELDELMGDDMERLIVGIKEYGQFDIVVVDTDSVMDSRRISLMKSSDCIVLVLPQNIDHRIVAFERELDKILGNRKLHQGNQELHQGNQELHQGNQKLHLCNKMLPVINKHVPEMQRTELLIDGKPVSRTIPLLSDLYVQNVTTSYFNYNNTTQKVSVGYFNLNNSTQNVSTGYFNLNNGSQNVTTGYFNLNSSMGIYIKHLATSVIEKIGCNENGG